jgi:two-component system, NarL family, sensor histidine kinase LiaS
MKRREISRQCSTSRPENLLSTWRGLQSRMTLSYILVTVVSALVFEIFHMLPFPVAVRMHLTWNQVVLPDIIGLLIVSLLGGLFGVVSTRGLIGRLRRIAGATTLFAMGKYDQYLPATAADEIGQLEAHFNQMAQQLALHIAREKLLVEQNVRLQERSRLSRDLHDSVKQHVFALAMQVELARSLLDQDRAAAWEHLGFADELSYQIQRELTALIYALRPADLQTKGLSVALRDYATAWSRQSGIPADLQFPETSLLPSSIEEALWWLTQEALSNVARHSQASLVCLHLEKTEHYINLSVSDNGQGFGGTVHENTGLGLRSMRERIEQIGGTILIQSESGQGTHIVARCPLVYSSDHAQYTHEVTP